MKLKRPIPLALSLLMLCGCTNQPVQPDPAPAPELPQADPPATQVQVDWSKLQQTKGDAAHPDHDAGRWYADSTAELIPREDYGPLYSYVGSVVQSIDRWVDENGAEQTWVNSYPTPVYGLMTRDGKIVTDPVYQGVYQPTYRHGSQVIAHPALLLCRASEEWNEYDTNGQRYAVAAKDGSWCTDFEFWTYTMNADALLLVGPGGVTHLDPLTGARQDWSWEHLNYTEKDLSSLLGSLLWLYGFQWTDEGAILGLTNSEDWDHTEVRLFHPENGTISIISRQEFESLLDADLQRDWNEREQWEFSLDGSQIILSCGEEEYTLSSPAGMNNLNNVEVDHGLVILTDYSNSESGSWLYDLSTGALLAQANYIGFIQDSHNPNAPKFIHVMYENGSQALYGPNFTPFLSYPTPRPHAQALFIYQDGLIFARDDATFFGAYDAQSGACIFYRNLDMGD